MTTRPVGFTARVLWVVRRIPPGRVATYGDVAALAGRPRAGRAVGNVMRQCSQPDVPCHRVIAAGGRLGGFGGYASVKRSRLLAEGVLVSGDRIRNLEQVRFQGDRDGRGGRTAAPATPGAARDRGLGRAKGRGAAGRRQR